LARRPRAFIAAYLVQCYWTTFTKKKTKVCFPILPALLVVRTALWFTFHLLPLQLIVRFVLLVLLHLAPVQLLKHFVLFQRNVRHLHREPLVARVRNLVQRRIARRCAFLRLERPRLKQSQPLQERVPAAQMVQIVRKGAGFHHLQYLVAHRLQQVGDLCLRHVLLVHQQVRGGQKQPVHVFARLEVGVQKGDPLRQLPVVGVIEQVGMGRHQHLHVGVSELARSPAVQAFRDLFHRPHQYGRVAADDGECLFQLEPFRAEQFRCAVPLFGGVFGEFRHGDQQRTDAFLVRTFHGGCNRFGLQ
uniref:Uncharacterized protein n=1 Tax=Anopheles coluzzii TaxID=1518534 RepID=A0A8W7PDD4_ANOCL